VSPSFSDRVEVFLGPRRIHLARRPRGWRARGAHTLSIGCPPGPDHAWQGAVETLGRALATLAWRKADAVVMLSNHFVRYALVPPVAGVKRADRAAVAQHQLHAIYGDAAQAWRVALDDAPADAQAVAGGVEPELVAQLEAVLRTAGLRPVVIEPYLAGAYNACRATMNGAPAWLAVAEPGRVCVAAVQGGRWLALRSQRVTAPLRTALPLVLEQVRLAAAQAVAAGPVYLVSRDEPPFKAAAGSGWSIEPVSMGH
jgi:hypothetical protein